MIDICNKKYKYVVISVVGHHAGESKEEIFARKIREIRNTGLTFWLYKSYNAQPFAIQRLCKRAMGKGLAPLCLFIRPSSKGGAKATKNANRAGEFSKDSKIWQKIPSGILVTGSVKNSFALVIDNLEIPKQNVALDLWDYSKFDSPSDAVQIRQGGSTICCVRRSSKDDPSNLASNIRKVLAIGTLTPPFGVWLK